MNMWLLSSVIVAFILVEVHLWLERRRQKPKEERMNVGQALRSVLPQEKAEYLLPMNDEEFEDHMRDSQDNEGLIKGVLAKMPWNSKHPNSPSLDSSSKKEL